MTRLVFWDIYKCEECSEVMAGAHLTIPHPRPEQTAECRCGGTGRYFALCVSTTDTSREEIGGDIIKMCWADG